MNPRLSYLVLPYTRLELPGWGHLFRAFKVGGIANHSLWESAPVKTMRGKWHGYLMKLDLSNWSERHTYFLGRFYDLDLQLLMNQVLESGDRFVDIGANIGMITLHAAALVKSSGRVDSFEPNPKCCMRFKELLDINNIEHVNLHQAGLAEKSGTLTLSVVTEHSGMGTLASPEEVDKDLISEKFEVPVLVGDDVLMSNSIPVKMVKIDVEGFELRVLRGLQKILNTWFPVVVTEVSEGWLRRAGTSVAELCQFMNQFGYSAYGLTTNRKFFHHDLHLVPISRTDAESKFTDYVWLHPKSNGAKLLNPFISKRG